MLSWYEQLSHTVTAPIKLGQTVGLRDVNEIEVNGTVHF